MPKKKFVLRIDVKTMSAVEKWAADEFRSVNGQLEWIITRALQQARRTPKEQIKPQVPKKDEQDPT